MGETENLQSHGKVVFSAEQLDILTGLLVRYLTRGNISWLATSVLGKLADQEAGNDVGDHVEFARRIVGVMNDAGKIPDAIVKLREHTHANARLMVALKHFLAGEVVTDSALQAIFNEYEPFVSSKKFQEYYPRVLRAVCAIGLGKPTNAIVGSGFLIAPDLVMTNFHVLETFLNVDPATRTVTANGPGKEMFFFFDYLSAPTPDVPPVGSPGSLVVNAADNWLVGAREMLKGDGTPLSQPVVNNEYDYAIVRLSKRVGALSAHKGGGGRRGWLDLPKEQIDTMGNKRIFVFQHPQAAPQQWDMGDFVQLDPTGTRVWYHVNTAHGSSGGCALDIDGQLYALHNAEVDTGANGPPEKKLNQGVRMDKIAEDLKTVAPAVLEAQPDTTDSVLYWSLSDDPKNLSPIIGRATFRNDIIEMLAPDVERVMVVRGPHNSGRRYSIRLLRHALGIRVPIVEFSPKDLQSLEPKRFLRVLINELSLTGVSSTDIPEVLSTENISRWLRLDLPTWLRDRLAEDEKKNPSRYPAWIVINTVMPKDERLLWADNLKDCVVALVGAHDPGQPNIEIPQLRWLFLASATENLPTGSVKQREEDLSNDTYADDFAACIALAYRSVDRDASLPELFLRNSANDRLRLNEAFPEAQRLAPRQALAESVLNLIKSDPNAGD